MGWMTFSIEGKPRRLAIVRSGAGVWIGWPGGARYFAPEAAESATGPARAEEVRAPMTAKVVKLAAAPGARVAQNQVLVVLEAMKMEYRLASPRDGVVAAVHCKVGELVELGRTLVALAPAEEKQP